ncbi:MAG: hypothetical protein J3K34DRAFT_399682 [Monoraphidium minutum]|nr:MAG: hypothetical protein J3K34DRAFT_399682 [Monoraphidium minutum]
MALSVAYAPGSVALGPLRAAQRRVGAVQAAQCGAPLALAPLLRGLGSSARGSAPPRRAVAAASRRPRPRRDDFDAAWRRDEFDAGGRGTDFGPRGAYTVNINGREVRVGQSELWRAALPAAALLGGALFLGPLVIAAAVGALALGAFVATAGVAMTAMFFPFLMFAGAGAALTFGAAALGAAVWVVPNLLVAFTLLAVGGGLLLGWEGINMLLGAAQQTAGGGGDARAADPLMKEAEFRDLQEERESEEARRAAEDELRRFDDALRRREREARERERL